MMDPFRTLETMIRPPEEVVTVEIFGPWPGQVSDFWNLVGYSLQDFEVDAAVHRRLLICIIPFEDPCRLLFSKTITALSPRKRAQHALSE
jgi:hypothetical protein